MGDILQLAEIDYWNLLFSICIVLLGVKAIIMLAEWFITKFGLETKAMRQKREEHELLIKTSQSLNSLKENHENDIKDLKDCLSTFIEETRKENAELRNAIKVQDENNLDHWDVSKGIRKELSDSIKVLADGQIDRDKQIEALMCGTKELLGDKIDQKYIRYINLNGIPENEVAEFDDIYSAYKLLLGNHTRDTKYTYVKNHLPVIPVETKLLIKHETE